MESVQHGQTCFVAGWGRLTFGGYLPKKLQELEVKGPFF